MAELPLSKFAPFTKQECRFQEEVSNKLDEIGVKCSNCIYISGAVNIDKEDLLISNFDPDKQTYKCSILSEKWGDNIVCENSLCRFFTNKEEVEDSENDRVPSEFGPVPNEEELSIQIQKLDFSNSEISNSINQLRDKLLNE